MKKRNSKKTGFTLIELLIVLAIIAVIFSIAIPKIVKANRIAYQNEAGERMKEIAAAWHENLMDVKIGSQIIRLVELAGSELTWELFEGNEDAYSSSGYTIKFVELSDERLVCLGLPKKLNWGRMLYMTDGSGTVWAYPHSGVESQTFHELKSDNPPLEIFEMRETIIYWETTTIPEWVIEMGEDWEPILDEIEPFEEIIIRGTYNIDVPLEKKKKMVPEWFSKEMVKGVPFPGNEQVLPKPKGPPEELNDSREEDN